MSRPRNPLEIDSAVSFRPVFSVHSVNSELQILLSPYAEKWREDAKSQIFETSKLKTVLIRAVSRAKQETPASKAALAPPR
jgi:hypothetical protein